MIEKITRKQFYDNIDNFINGEENKTLYWVYDDTAVNYGNQKDCNLEWCKEHNIEANDAKRNGGCIVSAKGNINMVDIRDFDNKFWYSSYVLKRFVIFLISKGLPARYDKNDVMIGKYKIASGISTIITTNCKRQYSGIQISINQDYEIIKNVCTKKLMKVPKALSDYGITTEDVENWINDTFGENSDKNSHNFMFKKQHK